ncbi:MAG: prolyl oligopeptidase family serine peptidase [Pseudomonadales bacterium]|nr:prolyl oligopeptidase family serine peptidase [Pseudomonadales bacterium]
MDHHEKTFAKTVEIKKEVEIPFRAYIPNGYSEGGQGLPLLLFLHGAGERGSDLKQLAATGLPKHIEEGLDIPFVTVCPQCPENDWWDPIALKALFEHVVTTYNVDESKLYLSGLSMGGSGTWQLANILYERLAAIAPVCPPFGFVNPANFKELPVWCFHGAMDSVIPVSDSVKMVRLLRLGGCNVKFTVYPDADHDSWTETYTNPALYDWLLEHTNNGE